MQQGQDAGGLGHQVLVHDVGGQVHVDVVSALDAAHQLVVMIQALGVLLVDQVLDLSGVHAVVQAGGHGLVEQGVLHDGGLVLGHEGGLQLHDVEAVADLHQEQELLLGHDLAVLAVTVGGGALQVHPSGALLRQLGGGVVADVGLVGPVSQHVLVAAQVLGQLLQVLAVGIDHALSGLGGAVVDDHVGGMNQNIAGSLDNTVHVNDRLSI